MALGGEIVVLCGPPWETVVISWSEALETGYGGGMSMCPLGTD